MCPCRIPKLSEGQFNPNIRARAYNGAMPSVRRRLMKGPRVDVGRRGVRLRATAMLGGFEAQPTSDFLSGRSPAASLKAAEVSDDASDNTR